MPDRSPDAAGTDRQFGAGRAHDTAVVPEGNAAVVIMAGASHPPQDSSADHLNDAVRAADESDGFVRVRRKHLVGRP
jgi:hypothetical protein